MLHLQTGNGDRLDIPDMSARSKSTGRFRLPSGGPGHTLFKIVSSARGYHAWAWQSFGIFLFLWHAQSCQEQGQTCGLPHAVWNGNLYGPFLFCCQKCPQGLARTSGWIFVEDICANAKGYGLLYQIQRKGR